MVNPQVQTVQNLYGKGGQRVSKAELWLAKSDLYFERKKITLGGVGKSLQAAILTLEPNPPERKFLYMLKIFSQEDFALKSKLRPGGFLEHLFWVSFSSRNKGQLWPAVTRP